uniref:Actin related protein 5 n=1 Tax=Salmo trutta TaxID=8032 RepID=A0A674EDP2_SALTR
MTSKTDTTYNGYFQRRAGAPRLLLKSLAARIRGTARSESQIRNGISNLEPLRWLLKSRLDRNVVVNFEIQELLFDSATSELAPCNPLHSRQMMSVLTLHHCPHVSYWVDSLYHCAHILPVINGRCNMSSGVSPGWMRVNVGGSQVVSYLQRLFQLKYTGHLAAVTLYVIELLHKHSYRLPPRSLEKWCSAEFYEQEVQRMQLPFSAMVLGGVVIVEEMQERRAQQLRRLQEINAWRREEMLQQDQERLDKLLEMLEDGYLEQFHKNLVQLNMDSAEELQSYINKLSLVVDQGRQRLLQVIIGSSYNERSKEILDKNLLQSAQDLRLGQRFPFQQDSDPKHTAKQVHGTGLLKRLGRKNQLSSVVTLTTEIPTASGNNVSTRTVRQEFYEMSFYGRAAAHTSLRSPCAMPSVGWSGVKLAAIGLWGSGNAFSGVLNHASPSRSPMDKSGFGECQENATCLNA